MASVLVTGGSGFIGFNLVCKLVERGDDVTVLVRSTSRVDKLRQLGVKLAEGDLLSPELLAPAVRGKDVVYHVAGVTRTLNPRDLWKINELGVAHMAAACAAQDRPPVLIVVSSLAAAGPSKFGQPRREEDPPRPVSFYGRSKLAGEMAARRYAGQVPITVVRPPVVFGPHDPNSVPMFRSVYRWGVHLAPGWGRRQYSLIHAEDLVHLLILAAERGERLEPLRGQPDKLSSADLAQLGRGVYYAAGPEFPSWAEVGRLLGKVFGRNRVWIIRVAAPGVWMIATCVECLERLRRKPMYLDWDKAREITSGSWACSGRKAAEQLGFAPAFPLLERLRQTAEWYRQAGWI
ncbi:MAG: NAD-dependent epimerase/dehydratase family protein [Thermoguttaceae bacterium]|nr:NAD-dependent epimerase/dehydratase family protein [Thermoguttaceae bacterium]MDW8078726.1 NAD-dependent epimerase/dehydratase family protein [Thermoguttaceae bacterium]